MKQVLCWMAVLACAAAAIPVVADADKDQSGYGRYKHERLGYQGGEAKEEYWDGDCQVEREWKKNGKYKEKRTCAGFRRYGNDSPPVYQEPDIEPGIIVQPPAVIVQPVGWGEERTPTGSGRG